MALVVALVRQHARQLTLRSGPQILFSCTQDTVHGINHPQRELNSHCFYGTKVPEETRDVTSDGWSYSAIVNAPNALSFARLVSGPAIAGLIIHGHVSTAVPLFLVSGATDWLDGYLARKQGLKNNILGSYLDPLADKVLVGSVVCSMGYSGLMSPYVCGLIVARDVSLIAGAFWARAHALKYTWPGITAFFNISGTSSHAAPKAEPLYISKVNTVVQIALVSSCLADSWIGWPGSSFITNILEPATAITTAWSFAAYIHAYTSGQILLSHSMNSKKNLKKSSKHHASSSSKEEIQ